MGSEASLTRLIVVGHDDQRCVGPDIGCRAHHFNRRSSGIAAAARNYRHPAPRDLHSMSDYLSMLVPIEGRTLTSRPAGYQPVGPLRDLPFDELSKCVFGDTAAGKWRNQCRNRPEKHELASFEQRSRFTPG